MYTCIYNVYKESSASGPTPPGDQIGVFRAAPDGYPAQEALP